MSGYAHGIAVPRAAVSQGSATSDKTISGITVAAPSTMTLFVCSLLLLLVAANAALIANPAQFVAGLTEDLKLNCSIDPPLISGIQQLLLVQMQKEEAGSLIPLVTLLPGSSPKLETTSLFSSKVSVRGNAEQMDIANTFLEVIIHRPSTLDRGTFVCAFSVLDKSHLLSKIKSMVNVTSVNIPSTQDLTSTLVRVLDRLASVEKEVTLLTTEKTILEAKLDSMEKQECNQTLISSVTIPNPNPNPNPISNVQCQCQSELEQLRNDLEITTNATFKNQEKIDEIETRQVLSEQRVMNVTNELNDRVFEVEKNFTSLQGSSSQHSSEILDLERKIQYFLQVGSTDISPTVTSASIYHELSYSLLADMELDTQMSFKNIGPDFSGFNVKGLNVFSVMMNVCLKSKPLTEAQKTSIEALKASSTPAKTRVSLCLGLPHDSVDGLCERCSNHQTVVVNPDHPIASATFQNLHNDNFTLCLSARGPEIIPDHLYLDSSCTIVTSRWV